MILFGKPLHIFPGSCVSGRLIVTSDAAVVSPIRRGSNPALAAALLIAIIAAATLCGAWYFQYFRDIQPCPLCLEQRYAYYLAIPLAVLTATAAGQGAPWAMVIGEIAN